MIPSTASRSSKWAGFLIDRSDPLTGLPNASALRGLDGSSKEYLGVFVDRLRGRIRDDAG